MKIVHLLLIAAFGIGEILAQAKTCLPYQKKAYWGQWSIWSECTHTCRKPGIQERSRDCIYHNCTDGTPCIGEWKEKIYCHSISKCKVPKWGKWTEWSDCDVTECRGKGMRSRIRVCKNIRPHPSGRVCSGPSEQFQPCYQTCCPAGFPKWAKWREWTACTPSCGLGVQARSRKCLHGNKNCKKYITCEGITHQKQQCFNDCCGNIQLGQWTPWSGCTDTCVGGGFNVRTRTCSAPNCTRETEQCANLTMVARKCPKITWFQRECPDDHLSSSTHY